MNTENDETTVSQTDMTAVSADNLPEVSDGEMRAIMGDMGMPLSKDTVTTQPKQTETVAAEETEATQTEETKEEADPIGEAFAAKAAGKADKRDYSGIDPADIDLFKNMSTSSFKKAKEWYAAAKAAGDLPSKYEALNKEHSELSKYRWHGHPESYRLTEEYQQLEQRALSADRILNHWQQQLESLEAGELKMQAFEQDAKGNLVPVPVVLQQHELPRAKVWVQQQMQAAYADRALVDRDVGALKEEHSKRFTSLDTDLDNLYKGTLGKYEQHLKASAEKHLAAFPKHFTTYQGQSAKLLAYSLAALEVLAAGTQKAKVASAGASAAARTAKSAGPTNASLAFELNFRQPSEEAGMCVAAYVSASFISTQGHVSDPTPPRVRRNLTSLGRLIASKMTS
jgi:hypothetical protein